MHWGREERRGYFGKTNLFYFGSVLCKENFLAYLAFSNLPWRKELLAELTNTHQTEQRPPFCGF